MNVEVKSCQYDLNVEKMQEILKRDLTSKNWQGYCKDRSEHAPSTLCLVHTEQGDFKRLKFKQL